MAVRQLIPMEKVTKCHVNSVDVSMVYESGVSYEAGEAVSENKQIYLPISALTASHIGPPSEAPSDWPRVSGVIGGE